MIVTGASSGVRTMMRSFLIAAAAFAMTALLIVGPGGATIG